MNTLAARTHFLRTAPQGRAWRALQRLGSLRLTLVILIALAAGVVAAYQSAPRASWPIVVPLGFAAINLFAAIITNGVFRWKLPLLVFHLCLLALVVLVACGRLTYLKGRLELTDGAAFSGELSAVEAGPWHAGRLREVRFVNQGFRIDYAPGIRRGPTRNAVAYVDEKGRPAQALIGDQTPLVVHGYRFYTSFNKGFAPTFAWQPRGAPVAQIGSVHLPAYPLHEYRQARTWRLPASEGDVRDVWIMLQFDENLLDPSRPDEFKLPREHRLVLRSGDERRELAAGEGVDIAGPGGGRLTYLGLRAWMGYTVFYDWTLPWLLAAALAAACSLAAHFWQKFAQTPWQAADTAAGGA